MQQAESVKQLTAELDEAKRAKTELEAAVEKSQADKKALESDNSRLTSEMSTARASFKATLRAE